jgi:hypothetical protein
MSLLDRLRYAAETFLGLDRAQGGPPGRMTAGSSWVGGPLTTDAWKSHPAPVPWELVEAYKSICYSCANINADAVAAVPRRLYANASGTKKPRDIAEPRSISRSEFEYLREMKYVDKFAKVDDIYEIRNHPFLDTLKTPDPRGIFDQDKLIKLIIVYQDIVGHAFLYPEGPEGRPPQWLWPLFSQYVTPITTAGSPLPSTFSYFGEQLGWDQVVQFRHTLSLRNPYALGYSPAYAAIEYLRLEDRFVSVQEQLLAMGPRPNIIASVKDPNMPVGQNEKDRFEQDLNRKHARSAQGGVLVVNGSWDFTPVTYSPTDLSGLKVAEYDLERACGCFGVPIEFFTSDTNLANQRSAETKHAKKAVRPRCVSLDNRLTMMVRKYDPRLFFASDNCVPEDEEMKAKIQSIKITDGTLTVNQANVDTGIPPMPGFDEPWLPTNLAPASQLLEIHKAAVAMSQAGAVGMKEGGGNPGMGYADVKKKPKKKGDSNGGGKPSAKSGGSDKPRSAGGVQDSSDASIHAGQIDVRNEYRRPFSWETWSADHRSGKSD